MLFPYLCIDNFFNEPEKIVEYSKTLDYAHHPYGKWPGERTQELHKIDNKFHLEIGKKVLATLYPNEYKSVYYGKSELMFNKISQKHKNLNWVHSDAPFDLTVIIYLSHHKNCGTSIFECVKNYPTNQNLEKTKYDLYSIDKFKENGDLVHINNKDFRETISFKSKFNRAIMFDSYHWHASQIFFEENNIEDRLTLVGFYSNFSNTKFHVVENNRI